MFTKTITYTDYNGDERTEDFLFNLSMAEITEMELSVDGGLTAMLKRITDAKDGPAIIKVFKDLILRSYGEISADGRRFVKSEKLSTEFAQTEAYSKLFMELALNPDVAAEFVNGLVPSNTAI